MARLPAGGANVPALNDLLAPYGIAFGDAVLEGQADLDGEQIYYASGANIVNFPAGGFLHAQSLADKAATGGLLLSKPFFHAPPVSSAGLSSAMQSLPGTTPPVID